MLIPHLQNPPLRSVLDLETSKTKAHVSDCPCAGRTLSTRETTATLGIVKVEALQLQLQGVGLVSSLPPVLRKPWATEGVL